ncbi:hypothetical protein [Arthrobacter sp. CJ23]|uniref:hypothetical protein n=1 Tax=Arthrobacter sp. CJ23 TaxID=2972479 RepID=UPI00215B993B|nr:hypothetical protein [Arthrobacter sp. CJ23]UVJ40744.1 hypothetical protein NVV90_06125 [Arthrobacter sp. CJ23]
MKRRELAEHRAVLGFTPREAVRWLSPMSLARTALKVMAATVFADFGDKRELEGGFPSDPLDLDRLPVPGQPAQPPVGSRSLPSPGKLAEEEEAATAASGSAGKELWLDFAADLGDGFDATYSVALLLAQESLDAGGTVLPRGKVLVLGGDEVYPVASPAAYEDRMAGPYRMAFPAPRNPVPGHLAPVNPAKPPAAPAAVMLALPGNHDWYDGLTSFIRLFTRQRSIGAWRTIQTRSYFAVRLSGEAPREGHQGTPGWWLLGLDSQLGQYIDEPQLDYFYRNVTTQLQDGDAIILCVAAPYWVYADRPGSGEFRQVNFFEQDYLRRRFNPETGLFEATGAGVRLWLSGDLHHYSRYEQRGPGEAQELPPDPARAQLFTCGLGGAYLSDAHWLPQNVVLPPPAGSPGESAAQPPSSAVPETNVPGASGAAASGSESSGAETRGRRFTRMPSIYPQPADSQRYGRRLANPLSPYWLPVRNPGFGVLLGIVHMVAFLTLWTVFSAFRGLSFVDSLRSLTGGNTLLLTVLLVAAPLLLLGVLALLAKWLGLARRGLVVFLRGALYQLSALAVSAAVVILIPWPHPWPHFLIAALSLALVHLGGWAVGSEAFAFFIQGTPGGEVASWRMSGQAIEDHKGFLRLHLAPDGSVTVYPLAVDGICRDWQLQENDDGARLVPASGLPAVRLLEQPVTIARKGA